jgi:hypothetical protein
MSTFHYVNFPAYPPSLAVHFGNPDTTVITSEMAAGLRPTESYEGILFPDLLIAFNADSAACRARNGYLIPEQGKPPDLVLEVASESTGRRDETVKRDAYAAMGIPEYWRFDHSGGLYHRTHLAGDTLVAGRYQPIPISRSPISQSDEEHFWGRSTVLNLDLCWEEGILRFWDPVARRYLTTYHEEHAARREAETQRDSERQTRADAEAQRDSERQARAGAEARIRRLEEELRRRSNP